MCANVFCFLSRGTYVSVVVGVWCVHVIGNISFILAMLSISKGDAHFWGQGAFGVGMGAFGQGQLLLG